MDPPSARQRRLAHFVHNTRTRHDNWPTDTRRGDSPPNVLYQIYAAQPKLVDHEARHRPKRPIDFFDGHDNWPTDTRRGDSPPNVLYLIYAAHPKLVDHETRQSLQAQRLLRDSLRAQEIDFTRARQGVENLRDSQQR